MVGLPIVVRPRVGTEKDRLLATYAGVRAHYRLGVHNNSLNNVLRGLTERVYCVETANGLQPPPQPKPNVFSRLSAFADKVVRSVGGAAPWSYQEFIDSCKGPKRKLYQTAVESLQLSPLSKEDARLKTFVKAEKLDLHKKEDPAPRLIQPRSPRYNAWVGRYLKAAEHRIYAAIDEVFGSPTIMSGYNATDVARNLRKHWDTYSDVVAVGLDASRFDQHVSEQALRWEHSVYNRLYRSGSLAEVLEWQITNRGTAHTPSGTVKYQVKGKRMSGDMNTSLGNKLIMCGLVWTYAREKRLDVRLANNGDDCVVFMNRRTLRRFMDGLTEWFLEFGFTMKVEPPVSVFEHVEFCQQRPVFDGRVWLMTRSPIKGLAKDVTMISPNPTSVVADYKKWATGVGVGGLAAYGGMPVVQEVYLWMSRLSSTPGSLEEYSGIGAAARGSNRKYEEPTAVCRASYAEAWGVSPSAQVVAETWIRQADKKFDRLWLIDLADQLAITCL